MNALYRLQKLAAFKLDGVDPLLSIASPQTRGILGGALAGGAVGGYAGGEENRKKGILAGALAGGLGGGAIADVMANRTARGFKLGDDINMRATGTNIKGVGDIESIDIGKGRRGITSHTKPSAEEEYARRGINREDIADHLKDKYGDNAWEVSDDIRASAIRNQDILRYDSTIEGDDMKAFRQLGDAYRNRALKRGAGALAAGGAGAYINRRKEQEKQASVMYELEHPSTDGLLHRLQKLAAFKIDGVDPFLGIASPQARGILGGAIAGGTAGGYAGGKENRKKGILAGAIAGGLGGGAIADVMANRTARGLKLGDEVNIRHVFKDEDAPGYARIGKGALGVDYMVEPDDFRELVDSGLDHEQTMKYLKDQVGDNAGRVYNDLALASLSKNMIHQQDDFIREEDMEVLHQLGDAYRNRALKRGAGALAAGGAGVLASRRDREKQASFVYEPSILGANLEKRASMYGGAAAGGLLGAAYGHFGTKKEDRNWKRTLGHAGVGALTGGSMGLARKRGLEIGSLNEEAKGLRGSLTDLQGELASTNEALRNKGTQLTIAEGKHKNMEHLYERAKSARDVQQGEVRRLQGELREAQDTLESERRRAQRQAQRVARPAAPVPAPEGPLNLSQRLAHNRNTQKFKQGTEEGRRFTQEAYTRARDKMYARAREAEELKRTQAAQAAQLEKEKERARQAAISAVRSRKLRRAEIAQASKVEPDDIYNELSSGGRFRADLDKMIEEGRITEDQADSYDALRFVLQDPAKQRLRERYMAARARRDAQSKTASLMCAPSILGSAYWY